MKTITIDRISLLDDYVNNSDKWIEGGDSVLQFCIRSLKENIICLTMQKDDPVNEEIDNNVYATATVLRYLEQLLKEAEAIRKEGNC